MAAHTVGVLSIDLIGNIGGFEKSMRRANLRANEFSKKLTIGIRNAHSELLRLAGPAAAFLSVRQVGQYAQAWTELNNRLKQVTVTATGLAQANQDVYRIAQATGSTLDATSQVYQRIAKNAGQYGLSLQGVASVTETVSKAVALSGASAASAEAALVQFGQALASGALRGDELNSIMEQTPGLSQAIADGLGVGIGQLREMGKQGKLTGQVVVDALQKAAASVDKGFANQTQTASQELNKLYNAFERLVGVTDDALGGSKAFGAGIQTATSYVESLQGKTNAFVDDLDSINSIFDSLGNNQGIQDLKSIIDDIGTAMGTLGEKTDAVTAVMDRSFGDFVASTVKEVEWLLNRVVAGWNAWGVLADGVSHNLRVLFEKAFYHIQVAATAMVNGIIDSLNTIGGVAGKINPFGDGPAFHIDRLKDVEKTYGEVRNVLGEVGSELMKNHLTFGREAAAARDAARAAKAYHRDSESSLADYLNDQKKEAEALAKARQAAQTASGSSGSGKKGRTGKSDSERDFAREQKQFADWMKRQREQIAMLGTETELEKLNAELKLGNWAKLSEAQKEEMKAMAERLDKAQEYHEALERLEELTGDKLIKEHLKDAQALGMAWQAGALSLDAYASRLGKLNLEGANERISRGMGTSQDMMQSILGKYSSEFKSTQEAIADSLGSSFASLSDSAGDTLGQMIFYGDEANASFGDIAKTIGVDMVKALTTMGIQMLAQKALGTAINTASTAEATATGAAVTSAMAPAAATASVATFGGASVAGLAGLMAVATLLPTLFGKGFAEGGFTGQGGKYDAAGIVHAGEYVFNAQRVREIGLDNLRRLDHLGGFAEGGYVGANNVGRNVASLSSGASTGELKLNIETHTSKPLTFDESRTPAGERLLIVKEAVKMVAASMGNPNSDVSRALGKHTHAKRRF